MEILELIISLGYVLQALVMVPVIFLMWLPYWALGSLAILLFIILPIFGNGFNE